MFKSTEKIIRELAEQIRDRAKIITYEYRELVDENFKIALSYFLDNELELLCDILEEEKE